MSLCPLCGSTLRRSGDSLVCYICNYKEDLHDLVLDDAFQENNLIYSTYLQLSKRTKLQRAKQMGQLSFEVLLKKTIAVMEQKIEQLYENERAIGPQTYKQIKQYISQFMSFFQDFNNDNYYRLFAQIHKNYGFDLLSVFGDGGVIFSSVFAYSMLFYIISLNQAYVRPQSIVGDQFFLPNEKLMLLQYFFQSSDYQHLVRQLDEQYKTVDGQVRVHMEYYRLLQESMPQLVDFDAITVEKVLREYYSCLNKLVAYFPQSALDREIPLAGLYALQYAVASNIITILTIIHQKYGYAFSQNRVVENTLKVLAGHAMELEELQVQAGFFSEQSEYISDFRAQVEQYHTLLSKAQEGLHLIGTRAYGDCCDDVRCQQEGQDTSQLRPPRWIEDYGLFGAVCRFFGVSTTYVTGTCCTDSFVRLWLDEAAQ